MNILLDSSVLIDLIKGKVKLDFSEKYYINPIVYSEVLYGLLYIGKSETDFQQFLESNRVESISIGTNTAGIYTNLKLKLRENNDSIADNDLLIGASCLEHDLTLYTLNTKHFKRIPNLKLL